MKRISRLGLLTAMSLALELPAQAQAQAQAADPAATAARIAPAALRQDLLRGIYEIAAAPGQGAVFVASTPAFEEGRPGYVDLLDATDLRPLRRIELPRRAFALATDAKRGRLYVGNTMDGSLSVLDMSSGLPLGTIQLGKPDGEGFEHTRMIEVDPDSGRVYVTGPSDAGTVWIVDPVQGNAVQRIDNAGLWTAGLALDARAGRVYATNGGMNEVLVLDAATGARLASFSTGDTKAEGQDASRHFFVNAALDDTGKRLFAVDANSGQVYVFDTANGAVLAKVPVGLGALDVIHAPGTGQIIVTYRGASREKPDGTGGVVLLKDSDYTRLADLSLPVHPNSLALSEDGTALFVSIKAPMADHHPLYRRDGLDTVLRLDLQRLAGILAE
ncbi:MAG: YncE family protein [Paracoccus sp. (in: a-proteobacteria)]|uniref:YncE family protein n=1 Tax=Paracoccus sp. TaxID=267 RepID=UPI0039E59802